MSGGGGQQQRRKPKKYKEKLKTVNCTDLELKEIESLKKENELNCEQYSMEVLHRKNTLYWYLKLECH